MQNSYLVVKILNKFSYSVLVLLLLGIQDLPWVKNRLRGISMRMTENCKFGETHFSLESVWPWCFYFLQVHFALYRNETLVLSLIFNATGSDKLNWFSKTRLIYSPWTDLENGQTNYFSLMGNLSSNRSFYINKVRS